MTSSTSRLSEVREYVARMKLSLEEADLTGFARDCHQIRVMLDSIIHSETGTVEPEHLQDAPRVAREKFKVPNPFPHDPKKPEQSEISVVFSSFAACIERETNTLRSLTPSASGAVEALRECRAYFERELADDQTLIDGDFGTAYRLTVAALAAAESRSKE
jgi:hypothetical protein